MPREPRFGSSAAGLVSGFAQVLGRKFWGNKRPAPLTKGRVAWSLLACYFLSLAWVAIAVITTTASNGLHIISVISVFIGFLFSSEVSLLENKYITGVYDSQVLSELT